MGRAVRVGGRAVFPGAGPRGTAAERLAITSASVLIHGGELITSIHGLHDIGDRLGRLQLSRPVQPQAG